MIKYHRGRLRSWSYGSWIYNYLCNQCLSPLKLWVQTPFMARCTQYNISDKACQWLATGWWLYPGTPVSSTNITDCQDITEILLKVALNTITPLSSFQKNKANLNMYILGNYVIVWNVVNFQLNFIYIFCRQYKKN